MRAGYFENNVMDMSEATRILIVDDSEDDSLLISRQLQREIPNAAFRRVDTEESMISALHEHDWDLVERMLDCVDRRKAPKGIAEAHVRAAVERHMPHLKLQQRRPAKPPAKGRKRRAGT